MVLTPRKWDDKRSEELTLRLKSAFSSPDMFAVNKSGELDGMEL